MGGLANNATWLAALAACCVAVSSRADEPRRELEPTVVTANRATTAAADVGAAVTVLDQRDIERRQSPFLAELLREVPGVSVNQTGAPGGFTSLRMRGANGFNTLVLIDGVEVSDPSGTQTSFDFAHLLASEVDRVEVLRGSQSTLYGGDAVGGVVNIITKRGQGPVRQQAQAEAGSFKTARLGYGASGGFNGGGFAFRFDRLVSSGFSAADQRDGNVENDPVRNTTVHGNVDLDLADNLGLSASLRAVDATFEFDGFPPPAFTLRDDDLVSEVTQRSGRLAATLSLLGGRLVNQLGLGHSINTRDNFRAGRPNFFADGRRLKLDYQGIYTHDASNRLVFGAEGEREGLETNTQSKTEIGIAALYAQYELKPWSPLTLTLGGRLDSHETFGEFDTYRATAAYRTPLAGLRLRTSYGTGFRAPSLFELFAAPFGNVDLQPETSRSWDAGFDYRLAGDRLELSVAYFDLRIEDRIAFVFGPGPNYFQVPGRTDTGGIEASARWQALASLALHAAYTYTDTKDTFDGARLPRVPRHVVNALAQQAFLAERASLALHARYVAGNADLDFARFPAPLVPLKDYLLLGLALSYKLTEGVEARARAENLLNRDYQEVLGYGTAGRAAYLGLALRF